MTFAEMARKYGNRCEIAAEIGHYKAITINFDDSFRGPEITGGTYNSMSQRSKDIVDALGSKSTMEMIEVFLASKIFSEGPKIFRPTLEQLEALEKMRLNISIDDFNMPFETIVIELPEAYYQKYDLPVACCLQLHWDKKQRFFIHNLVLDGSVIKSWWRPEAGEDIETWFERDEEFKIHRQDSITCTKPEEFAEVSMRRAALNYCLLLDEVGVHKEHPASPNEYARLVKFAEKKTKHQERNRQQLMSQGMIYGLDRVVKLVREVASSKDLPEGTAENGREVEPHCRRGHYRMQPHGVGGLLRKRIRIPPVIVNKHLLLGPPKAQEYRT